MDTESAAQFEQNVRRMYDQMARIAIKPTWVRFFDFGAGRMPRFLQELAARLVVALKARGAGFTHVDLRARMVTSLAHYSAPGRPSSFRRRATAPVLIAFSGFLIS